MAKKISIVQKVWAKTRTPHVGHYSTAKAVQNKSHDSAREVRRSLATKARRLRG